MGDEEGRERKKVWRARMLGEQEGREGKKVGGEEKSMEERKKSGSGRRQGEEEGRKRKEKDARGRGKGSGGAAATCDIYSHCGRNRPQATALVDPDKHGQKLSCQNGLN